VSLIGLLDFSRGQRNSWFAGHGSDLMRSVTLAKRDFELHRYVLVVAVKLDGDT
jgi:hypothetical protein